MRANHFCASLAALALIGPTALYANEQPDPAELVAQAFAQAKSSIPSISVDQIACVRDQRAIALAAGSRLTFPCELQEVVESRDDAAMLVTLLLVEPVASAQAYEQAVSADEKAAALGAIVAGVALDPGSDLEVVERARTAVNAQPPSLAAFAPADSRTLKLEAARLQREEEHQRSSTRSDEAVRVNLRERREAEQARHAEYATVTRFLELANLQGICPADGRIYLQRASEYATSPVQEDRMYGLWADDKRHALEPYLNDLSRCR